MGIGRSQSPVPLMRLLVVQPGPPPVPRNRTISPSHSREHGSSGTARGSVWESEIEGMRRTGEVAVEAIASTEGCNWASAKPY